MKKTILFVYYRECLCLTPFIALLDSLNSEYSLKVISCEKQGDKEKLEKMYEGKDVSFIGNEKQVNLSRFAAGIRRRFKHTPYIPSAFINEAKRLIETTPYDLLWVIHEYTLFELRDYLRDRKYVVSLYELNDTQRDFLNKIKFNLQNASEVVVAEYNRGCILRTWLNLKKTPTVIPNKPMNHPRKRNIPNDYSDILNGRKVVLYQGSIVNNRNLDVICKAFKDMPEYTIVLMGNDNNYVEELKKINPNILYIRHITPPMHLHVTSCAHIAILKYDFVTLNSIYCAPNKTWEYSGFGIPTLCNAIPALQYTIGTYQAGVCTDLDDVDCVKEAVAKIEKNYSEYSKNALCYFESCDLKKELLNIAFRNVKTV